MSRKKSFGARHGNVQQLKGTDIKKNMAIKKANQKALHEMSIQRVVTAKKTLYAILSAIVMHRDGAYKVPDELLAFYFNRICENATEVKVMADYDRWDLKIALLNHMAGRLDSKFLKAYPTDSQILAEIENRYKNIVA